MPVVQDLLEGQGIFAQISSRALRILIIWSSWSSLAGQDEGESHKAGRQGMAGRSASARHAAANAPAPLCAHCSTSLCLSVSRHGGHGFDRQTLCPPAYPAQDVNRELNRLAELGGACQDGFKKHMRADGKAGGRDELSRIRFSEHWGPCRRTCDHSRPSRPRNRQVPLTTRNQQAAGCSAQFVLAWASHPPYVSHRGLPPFLLAMARSPAHGTDGTWAEGRQIHRARELHPILPAGPACCSG